MDSNSDRWRWSDLPAIDDEVSASVISNVSANAFSNEDSGTGQVYRSCASFVTQSTASGLLPSAAPSVSSSVERRASILSDVSSLSKSSVMGLDELFDDFDKRPQLARWHSNDLLFDQSLFPACPVRRSSLVAKNSVVEGRQKPARWSSGQLISMPPRPARKSFNSPSSSKYPSPNAKEIPSRRQMVKRAPSRVKSHGTILTNKSSSDSDKDRFCRCESERWGSSDGLHTSSKHLPQKPTRRSSVVCTQSVQGSPLPLHKSPSSQLQQGKNSGSTKDVSVSRNTVVRSGSNSTTARSPKPQRNHSPRGQAIKSGQRAW
jgi:hypothetical protein